MAGTGQEKGEVSAALAMAEEAEKPETAIPPPAGSFAAAYDSEFEGVWLYLRRLGIPAADIEDAVHDVFVVAHKRYATYDRARPLRPWLLGIAFRIAKQRRRQRRHEVELDEPAQEVQDTGQLPDDAFATQEAKGRLREALEAVDLQQRAVVVMHDLHDIPVPQIAEELGVPLNTVYSRLRLGRAKVAAFLRGRT